ncbi:hypothetical protein ALC62_14106 [Cyphomyrmex costatus]|uniref:Uncharacterized protein n=1 Tax=Cyphomyrmex costatus TaxID=456900 RepID=A0A195C4U3_9HYME|nr:hypothetical protein ALC62_14106 [Cyphomyrmex costatus]
MMQCGAVLERENGVDGFCVYLAVTWEDFMIFFVAFRLADFNPRYSTTKTNRKFLLFYLFVSRLIEAYYGMHFLQFANDGNAPRASRPKRSEVRNLTVVCRWKKRGFAMEEGSVLYHNETAARTEMDSGDYEILVSGRYNRLLT